MCDPVSSDDSDVGFPVCGSRGSPSELEQGGQSGLHGQTRKIDVGRFKKERFAVMAGAGFDAEMIRDAEAVRQNTPATVLGYRYELGGHIADLTAKTTPEGRHWRFVYDEHGNLVAVTDPKGTVTADQEFPEASPRVTAEEITGAGPPPGEPPAQPKPRTARKTRTPPADSGEQDASLPATPAQDGPPLPGEEEPDPAAPDATQTAHQDSPVPAGDPGEDDGTPGTVTGPQITAIWTVLSQVFKFTRDEKDAARQVCAHIAGRPLGSTKDMSRDDGRAVLDTLANWRELAESSQMTPREALTEIMADAAAAAGSDGSAEAGDG